MTTYAAHAINVTFKRFRALSCHFEAVSHGAHGVAHGRRRSSWGLLFRCRCGCWMGSRTTTARCFGRCARGHARRAHAQMGAVRVSSNLA